MENECSLESLIPGIVKSARAVDITRLNFFPKDEQMTGLNGFGEVVIRLNCKKGRKWKNPLLNLTTPYEIPDTVAAIDIEPAGQLVQTVTIHTELDSLKKSLDIHGELSLKKEGLGEFSLSGGYKDAKEDILSKNFTIIDVSFGWVEWRQRQRPVA